MTAHNFAPASPDESIVHGVCRPGYPSDDSSDHAVNAWIKYMQNEGIEQVCCLLQTKQNQYNNLLEQYEEAFGEDHVCHAPVPDYDTVSERTLTNDILPFLEEADEMDSRVVVHCSAGMGRTGHVLALWLSAKRGYSLDEAIRTVRKTGRSPLEAASKSDLRSLHEACND